MPTSDAPDLDRPSIIWKPGTSSRWWTCSLNSVPTPATITLYTQRNAAEATRYLLGRASMSPEWRALGQQSNASLRRASRWARTILNEPTKTHCPQTHPVLDMKWPCKQPRQYPRFREVAGVALFGSVFKGTDRPDSDVDRFVSVTENPTTRAVAFGLLDAISNTQAQSDPVERLSSAPLILGGGIRLVGLGTRAPWGEVKGSVREWAIEELNRRWGRDLA